MRALASFAVGLIVVCAPAFAGGANISGQWSGEMRQIDPGHESKYPMTLSLAGAKGATTYPTLNCSGAWTRVAETKDGYAIYRETVMNEPSAGCIDGIFTVRADAGKLIIGWFGVFEGTPSLASAVLAREAKQ